VVPAVRLAAPRHRTLLPRLRQICGRFGTPLFAYDLDVISAQIRRLSRALSQNIEILYSLKANPSLGLCRFIAQAGLGADVSSIGELKIALQAGYAPSKIYVSGPYKSPQFLIEIRRHPEITLSIDSVGELISLAESGVTHRVVLRLRPDFQPGAIMPAGTADRFGIPVEDFPKCRPHLSQVELLGFHVFYGSQILCTSAVVDHLWRAHSLATRAAKFFGCRPVVLNLGGGFGVPYRPNEQQIDLGLVGVALRAIKKQDPGVQITIELGRFLVAEAGWYVTSVVGHQRRNGMDAVIVDGGTHQRADLCGIGLRSGAIPPLVINLQRNSRRRKTDVFGCLCLPTDVLAEGTLLPPLRIGDLLAFPNAGAYALSASPIAFLSHPYPSEIAFTHTETRVLRKPTSLDQAASSE